MGCLVNDRCDAGRLSEDFFDFEREQMKRMDGTEEEREMIGRDTSWYCEVRAAEQLGTLRWNE